MPPVIAAIVAAAQWVAAGIAVYMGSIGGIGVFLGKLALNFAISALVGSLSRKKNSGGGGYTAQAQDRQLIVRSSIQARNVVYGYAVTSGPLIFAHTTGSSKEYIHLVVALAGHEVDAIDSVFFNDEEIPVSALDANGNVTTGRFAGYARIKKHLGSPTQVADSDLVSEAASVWTTNHRLQGVAYLYVRLKHSYDVYSAGLPNIKALIRGKKVYDPRDAQTRWTSNSALIVRDYLVSTEGLSADASEIDDVVCAASANICDERVIVTGGTTDITADISTDQITLDAKQLRFGTGDGVRFTTTGTLPAPLAVGTTYYLVRLNATTAKLATTAANARDQVFIDITTAGSGVHTMVHYDQPRYTTNGVISTDATPRENMQALLTAMAGTVPWISGKYEVHAGAYTPPTLDLTEDDLRGKMSVQTRTPRKDLYNAVKGVYVEPWKYWQPTDFTPMTNATYEAQDGGARIYRDIEVPFTTNQIAAQRISKIHLEKSRQGITVNFPAKLVGLKTKAWATVTLTVAHLGWNAKVFRVINWALTPEGGVDLTLQEESSASYDWNNGEATVVDAAPDTTLPSRITVAPPSSLLLDSGSDQAFVNTDGTVVVQIKASWTAAPDAFATQYQIEWKLSTDTDYQIKLLPVGFTQALIGPAQEATYDVRVKAVNSLGVSSTYATGSIAATGKDTPPGDPSSLASQSAPSAVKLTWTNPLDNDIAGIEIWEASSDDRTGASKVADAAGNFFTRTGLTPAAVRYYWIRAVDTSGNLSGWHPTSSTAGVAGTAGSVAVDYGDVTGTKPPTNADNTETAVETGITITAGGFVLSSGGAIRGGQTDFATGIGFFLGYSTTLSDYVWSIGNPASNYLTWDGSTLEISGYVKNTKPYAAGDNVIAYDCGNPTSFGGATSYTKFKEAFIDRAGTVRVTFGLANSGTSNPVYGKIYVNGSPVGTQRSNTTTTRVFFTEDITVAAGDLVQVYAYTTYASSWPVVGGFKVSVSEPGQASMSF